ncbi:SigE family RNA polymerase sigma factor [Rugosimonospora acidiphila]|uniref:SigE family RNA polymerase sigma factor n=1 Tax=Rugosimonospora acidiphila TaxID=556531 RepID=A0ABP9RTQ8_9ACTN
MAEPDGFREYVVARQTALLRTAWLLTGDWQQAEDLVQAALAKVWPRWQRLTAQGEGPEGYVRRVIATTYLTWRRRRWWAERPTTSVPDVSQTGDVLAGIDLRDALGRILRQLPPAQRTVLVLRFYEDLSVEQTAAVLGCSGGTVKSQTAKALDKLKDVVSMGELR